MNQHAPIILLHMAVIPDQLGRNSRTVRAIIGGHFALGLSGLLWYHETAFDCIGRQGNAEARPERRYRG